MLSKDVIAGIFATCHKGMLYPQDGTIGPSLKRIREARAIEAAVLEELRADGVDFPKLPQGVGYLSLQIAAEVKRLIEDYGDRRAIAERDRICAAIKTEDDHCVTQGDYMLDSDDCIKVARGIWVRPDYDLSKAKLL